MAYLRITDIALESPRGTILQQVNLQAEKGEIVVITGPSGSGKSTLLNCISGILRPDAGEISVGETEITSLNKAKRTEFRLRYIGMIFQFGELLPELTVLENVALPLRMMGESRESAHLRASKWLHELGLEHSKGAHPTTLSGGEIQRAGIARALMHEPPLVLADEPTGALDHDNTLEVIRLLRHLGKRSGATVIIATHDPLVTQVADHHFRLKDGMLHPAREAL